MLQAVRAEKVDEKWGRLSTFHFFLLSCGPLIVQVHYLQFSADLCKKLEPVKTIYIYASESSHYTLSENDIVYRS